MKILQWLKFWLWFKKPAPIELPVMSVIQADHVMTQSDNTRRIRMHCQFKGGGVWNKARMQGKEAMAHCYSDAVLKNIDSLVTDASILALNNAQILKLHAVVSDFTQKLDEEIRVR